MSLGAIVALMLVGWSMDLRLTLRPTLQNSIHAWPSKFGKESITPGRPICGQASQKLSTDKGEVHKAPYLAEELGQLKVTKIKCIFFREVAPGRLPMLQRMTPHPCA